VVVAIAGSGSLVAGGSAGASAGMARSTPIAARRRSSRLAAAASAAAISSSLGTWACASAVSSAMAGSGKWRGPGWPASRGERASAATCSLRAGASLAAGATCTVAPDRETALLSCHAPCAASAGSHTAASPIAQRRSGSVPTLMTKASGKTVRAIRACQRSASGHASQRRSCSSIVSRRGRSIGRSPEGTHAGRALARRRAGTGIGPVRRANPATG
jgi:hypothetical protein